MRIQITIEVDGRQVQTFEHDISGEASQREEQAHRLGKSVGRVVAEQALNEAARTQVGCPRCCGKAMNNRGRTAITLQGLDGAMRVCRTRYRCQTCQRELYPADGLLLCGRHRITRPLAKRACQLATLEHFTELPQLLFDQHSVRISHEEERSPHRGNQRTAIDALIHYVQPRQVQTDYPTYRENGWQIGTGMIESTAKQLVGLRLKGPGMHWSEPGAIAMTALRAHSLNHHWHQFWATLVLNC